MKISETIPDPQEAGVELRLRSSKTHVKMLPVHHSTKNQATPYREIALQASTTGV